MHCNCSIAEKCYISAYPRNCQCCMRLEHESMSLGCASLLEALHARPCTRVNADEDVCRVRDPGEEGIAPHI